MSPLQSWATLLGFVAIAGGVLVVLTPRRAARVDDRPSGTAVPLIGGDGPTRGDGPSPLHLTHDEVAAAILLPDDEFAEYFRRQGSMDRHPSGAGPEARGGLS